MLDRDDLVDQYSRTWWTVRLRLLHQQSVWLRQTHLAGLQETCTWAQDLLAQADQHLARSRQLLRGRG